MILYQDGLIQLNYDPAMDILSVKWPDIQNYSLPEIQNAFDKLIDTLRHYDIKSVLIDTRSSPFDVKEEEYQELMYDLARNFSNTQVQKIARIQSLNPEHEAQTVQRTEKARSQLPKTIDFQKFSDRRAALDWLVGNE